MALRIHGIGVHFRFTSRGYPTPADDVELLGDSIETILKTTPGERVHRPSFGCDLKRLLFAGLTRATAVRAAVLARQAIERFEKRVIVDEITFQTRDSTILLNVRWRPKGNLSDARRLSIPFDNGGQR